MFVEITPVSCWAGVTVNKCVVNTKNIMRLDWFTTRLADGVAGQIFMAPIAVESSSPRFLLKADDLDRVADAMRMDNKVDEATMGGMIERKNHV